MYALKCLLNFVLTCVQSSPHQLLAVHSREWKTLTFPAPSDEVWDSVSTTLIWNVQIIKLSKHACRLFYAESYEPLFKHNTGTCLTPSSVYNKYQQKKLLVLNGTWVEIGWRRHGDEWHRKERFHNARGPRTTRRDRISKYGSQLSFPAFRHIWREVNPGKSGWGPSQQASVLPEQTGCKLPCCSPVSADHKKSVFDMFCTVHVVPKRKQTTKTHTNNSSVCLCDTHVWESVAEVKTCIWNESHTSSHVSFLVSIHGWPLKNCCNYTVHLNHTDHLVRWKPGHTNMIGDEQECGHRYRYKSEVDVCHLWRKQSKGRVTWNDQKPSTFQSGVYGAFHWLDL